MLKPNPGYATYSESEEFEAKPLIERNAIKLSKFERQWSTLGPLRSITFTVDFAYKANDEADSLAQAAQEEGFDVRITNKTDRNEPIKRELEATRMMEPTAEVVTAWEEWFQMWVSQVTDYEGLDGEVIAEFKGWSYPKTLRPHFDQTGRNDRENKIAAQERTRILFGQAICFLARPKSNWNKPPSEANFQLVPSEFLETAKRRRPSDPEPTASKFSQWLYSLYANAFGDVEDLEKGKAAEEAIFAGRKRAYTSIDCDTMRTQFSDWELKHNGLNAARNDRPNYYTIKDLVVRGEPLRALPDLIYENKRTGEINIVEIKHSGMEIPYNLWPNIWGQLWCYAQIEEFRDAPKVTVIGEVWGDSWRGSGKDRELKYVYLRASVRRNPRSIPFNRFFHTLFDIYRGAE